MQEELEALDKALGHPQKPVVALIGGSKISTKLDLLHNLVQKVDVLVLGGGMANTFLAAQGVSVGKSLFESDMLQTARDISSEAQKSGCHIILPSDVVVARIAEEVVNPARAGEIVVAGFAEEDVVVGIAAHVVGISATADLIDVADLARRVRDRHRFVRGRAGQVEDLWARGPEFAVDIDLRRTDVGDLEIEGTEPVVREAPPAETSLSRKAGVCGRNSALAHSAAVRSGRSVSVPPLPPS